MTNKRESCTMIFVNARREVLMILRDDKPGIAYPNTWDLPGGHLEGDETPQSCIRREMNEELPGVSLGAFQLYKDADFPDRIDHIFWTRLDATEEDLNRILREGQRTAWMSRSKLREVSIAFGFDSVLQEFWERVETGALRLEPPKNIVVCCDGTWNRFDRDKNTNVSKLCYCLEHHHPNQVMYYDPGVGTLASEQWHTWLGRAWSKIKGGAIGAGIARDIAEAYTFLSQQYVPGNRIFLFGFSRGAYAVRALAAVLKMYGLLERGNDNLAPYIKEMVLARRDGKPDFQLAGRFKHTFAGPVNVHFLGVWDTVSSVGWITSPVSLPYTKTNDNIEVVRHAVSIDERRKNFRHNLCKPAPKQDFKEVWFAGGHGDVGGGWPEAESGLSKISLQWMLREAEAHGLVVNAERRTRMLGGDNDRYCPPDALAQAHDIFSFSERPWSAIGWRLLQWLPRRTHNMSTDPPTPEWDWSPKRTPRFMLPNAQLHQSVVERWNAMPAYRPANIADLSTHSIET